MIEVASEVSLVRCTLSDIDHVCRNLPDDEIEQVMAALDVSTYDHDVFASMVAKTAGPRWAIADGDNLALAVTGIEPLNSSTGLAWMLATDESWATHGRAMTQLVRQTMDEILATDLERIEVHVLAERDRARRWYEKGLGMTCEGVMRRRMGGRDVAIYAKVKNHVLQ